MSIGMRGVRSLKQSSLRVTIAFKKMAYTWLERLSSMLEDNEVQIGFDLQGLLVELKT